jgi:uncharacterized membrane protein YdjX (TVP38/TMEM64 family)
MPRRRIVLIVVGVVVAALLVARHLPPLDADTVAARVRAAGALGPLVLFGVFVLQCVIAPIPSEPIMMAAGFVYGPAGGFTLAWLGVVAGASACFGLARLFGRPFAERFVRSDRLAALDAYASQRGVGTVFATVLGLRVLVFSSFDVLSYGCGLLSFPFRWFLLATLIGAVPKAFAFSYAGATAAARPGWLDALILVGTFAVLVVAPWIARRWSRTLRQVSLPAGERPESAGGSVP